MLKQLSYILTITLVYSQCLYTPTIPTISPYTFTINNGKQNTTNTYYSIATTNKNTQIAIAVNYMQAINVIGWSLVVKSKNETVIILKLDHVDSSWISLGGIVWQASSSEMIAGYHIIGGGIKGDNLYQMELKQTIKNQQASVAILFLNGVNMTVYKGCQLAVKAVRVWNQSVYINITTQKQAYAQIQTIHLSYIVFSPIYASFHSYGDSLTFNISNEVQYNNIYNDAPSTPYIIYGITSFNIKSQPSPFHFNSSFDNSYVLMVNTNISDITVDYLYLISLVPPCSQCGQAKYISNKGCVSKCPSGSFLGRYEEVQFCRICPLVLNMVVNQSSGYCECRKGYSMTQESKCVEIKATQTDNTIEVQKFIPLQVLNKQNTTANDQSKVQTTTNISDLTANKQSNQNATQQILVNGTLNATFDRSTANLTKIENVTTKTDISAIPEVEANITRIDTLPSTKTEITAVQTQIFIKNDSKQISNTTSLRRPTIISVNQTVKPIIPILVTSTSPTSSTPPAPVPNCSLIADSTLIAGRCVCQSGFLNISNRCVPLMDLVQNPTIPNIIKVTASVSCQANQTFSVSQNKCICANGYRTNNNSICQRFCNPNQRLNSTENTCICLQGYTKINDICQLCKDNGTFIGNETCYTLRNATSCRRNYTQSNGFCILCLNISRYSVENGVCSNCVDGLVYNGSSCVCPSNGSYVNGNCIGSKCGDKLLQSDQTCDDGNALNGDGCSSTCLVESSYSCQGLPSICILSICGDGIINGGQLCDDNNTINGDGCSDLCLIEANYSCISRPSACYPYQTGNLTVISFMSNTNIIYVELQTPNNTLFADPQLPSTFLKMVYLQKTVVAPTSYCRQQSTWFRFLCLLIYPSGIPNQKIHVLYRYSWGNQTGSVLLESSGGYSPLRSRFK